MKFEYQRDRDSFRVLGPYLFPVASSLHDFYRGSCGKGVTSSSSASIASHNHSNIPKRAVISVFTKHVRCRQRSGYANASYPPRHWELNSDQPIPSESDSCKYCRWWLVICEFPRVKDDHSTPVNYGCHVYGTRPDQPRRHDDIVRGLRAMPMKSSNAGIGGKGLKLLPEDIRSVTSDDDCAVFSQSLLVVLLVQTMMVQSAGRLIRKAN